MISSLGKYIPFIFLATFVFVFLDAIISFTVIQGIQQDQQTITYHYQKIHNIVINQTAQKELSTIGQERSALATSVSHMYVIIILSAFLNLVLLTFAYIVIMRELQERTLLEQKKNDFISLASHELKTPITSMNVFTQLMAKKIPKRNRQVAYLVQKMGNQVKEMANLINDLLDVTRIQLGKLELHKEHINLISFIQETLEDIQPTTKKHKITFRGPKNVEIIADKQRLWQVLTNLLNNAIKYSPKGGTIRVLLEKKRTRTIISIHDDGIGISKENQEHIFDRYFREETEQHDNVSGLGLGLFLARQIIQLHNGRIWVKSDIGKGATFSFTLPLAKGKKKDKLTLSPQTKRINTLFALW